MSLSTLRVLATSDPRLFAAELENYGLRVIGIMNTDPLDTIASKNDILSLASEMTESANDYNELNSEAAEARAIAEDNGYIVQIVEGIADAGEALVTFQTPNGTKFVRENNKWYIVDRDDLSGKNRLREVNYELADQKYKQHKSMQRHSNKIGL